MAVPTKNQLHRLVLEIAVDSSQALSLREVADLVAERLSLTEIDLAEQSSSGVFRVPDRTMWAMLDLRRSGLLWRPSRGRYQITDQGRSLLNTHEGVITDTCLRRLMSTQPIGNVTLGSLHEPTTLPQFEDVVHSTPGEQMQASYEDLRDKLAEELLESIGNLAPDRFELLVVHLPENMGYGRGETVGRSGDGGIDGIINQDALGLEKVYVQAKRWAGPVGEPEIRNFSGSLDPYGATKGVFITTSTFSSTARRTAATISAGNKLIRLVDGDELARLMIAYGVGVVTEYTYEIKKLDENYFAEDV